MLPYAVRLPHGSSPVFCARLETLLELRDEAVYLGLDELQRMCAEELVNGAGLGNMGERLSVHTLCDTTEMEKVGVQVVHGHGHVYSQSTSSSLHPHAHTHAQSHHHHQQHQQHPPQMTHMRTMSNAKPAPTGPLPQPPEPLMSPGLAGFQFPQRDQNDTPVQMQSSTTLPTGGQTRERQGSDGSLPVTVRNALHMRSKSRDPYGTPRVHATTVSSKPSENYF